ncbi:MAG: 3-hydroxyacyl-CoA dehydrogenase NAD-binding domain-containing protein [Actinomycetota bacterium]|nr:3-hydroxyacyl-CoA dehydrogenase NAD-binding domain-containing protein [Actinomycetota bacterium]
MANEVYTRFKVRYYDSREAGRLALVTMDNGADHTKPNTFGLRALESLRDALDEMESQSDVKGLMLTGKPFIFAAGADITAFQGADEEFAREAGSTGHALFRRLMDLPYPTLAAINGVCLGGGLEIALHCDYRTLSHAAGPIGFPEVFLSILPAWGGTQLTPRIAGPANALQVIVRNALDNNRTLNAAQAAQLGLVDDVLPSVDFHERSLRTLEELVTGERRLAERIPSTEGLDEALQQTRQYVDERVHGATRAPGLAIDLIEFAARGGDFDEGYRLEEEAITELLPARQAQAAVYAFQLTQQRIRKQPWRPDADPRPVRRAAIVGSGLMGAQLGSYFLQRLEVPIVMKDIDEAVLEQARQTIEADLDQAAERGRLRRGKERFLKTLVTYTTSYEPVAGADVVLEAVVERMDVKQRIFADLEEVVDDDAILASNTSSLSISEMAAHLDHPERVVGLHFFNPVRVMPFLEIVRTEAASDRAMATAFELSKQLRKSGVQCKDTPAFIVNRLLMRFNGACMQALRHGNPFTDIDDAIKQLGLPMGPFELLGFVGLKVAYHTAETLQAAFPDRFPRDENFRRFAELDVDGIYDWSRGRVAYDEVAAAVQVDEDLEPLSAEEIRQRALEATTDEAKIMLDEQVVADGRDIDTGLLLGAGWPFFMGGICKYADHISLSDKLFGRQLLTADDRAFA